MSTLNKSQALAAEAIKHGWSLVPFQPVLKRPIAGWTWKDDEPDTKLVTNQADAELVFAKDARPALHLRRSRLVCVDCDTHGGANGIENFIAWVRQHKIQTKPTWVADTPSGGKHFVWRVPDNWYEKHSNLRRFVGVLPGVDLLFDGCLILYGFTKNDLPEPALCPEWVLSLVPGNATAVDRLSTLVVRDRGRYIEEMVRQVAGQIAATPSGKRNQELFKRACRLYEMQGEELSFERIEQVCSDAARLAGLEEFEIAVTITSARNHVGSKRRTILVEEDATTWEQPLTIPVAAPPFPVDCLPPQVRAFASEVASVTETPIDAAAWCCIGVLAALAQHQYVVRVSPTWVEPLCFWALVGLESGENKSAVVKLVTAALLGANASQAERNKTNEARWRVELAEARRKCEAQDKINGFETDEDKQLRLEARVEAELRYDELLSERPPAVVQLVQDATPEALVPLLAEYGSAASISAEAYLPTLTGKRYAKDGATNVVNLLHAYSGERISVRRRAGGLLEAERPQFTMVGLTQPGAIRELLGDVGLRDIGFTPRCVIVIPQTMVGKRTYDNCGVSLKTAPEWNALVGRIYAPVDRQEPKELTLSHDASEWFIEKRREAEEILNRNMDLRPCWAVLSKGWGKAIRLGGLFALAKGHASVSLQTLQDAFCCVDYTMAAYERFILQNPLDVNVERLVAILASSGGTSNIRSVMRASPQVFPTMRSVKAVAERAEELGLVSSVNDGRRKMLVLNPLAKMPTNPAS